MSDVLSLTPHMDTPVLADYQELTYINSVRTLDISKLGDRSQGRPEGSFFNSYYTEV